MHRKVIRNAYITLVRKPEGKKTVGRSRHTLKENIKTELPKIGLKGLDWINMAQNRGW